MIRMYLFPFSLLIYKQKEVCMWKWIETTVLMEGVVDYPNITGNMFLCFHIEYFCFTAVKKTSVNPCQDRKKEADILWLDSEISVEEVWLFFSFSISNIS